MIDKNPGPGGAMTDGVSTMGFSLSEATDPTIEVTVEGDQPEAPVAPPDAFVHGDNLALTMDEDELREIADELLEKYQADCDSRSDWEKTYREGLKLLGLKIEEVSKPWAGACNVVHPLLSEAVVKFQAETILETFPAAGPVKTKIVGRVDKDREQAAERVKDDMNWRLTEQMPEFRKEHERLLWSLPIAGSAFKKVYYDEGLGRQVSMFVPAEDFVVSYGTSDLTTAERFTHRMRKSEHEILTLMRAGLYRTLDVDEAGSTEQNEISEEKDKISGLDGSKDDRHLLLEMHVIADFEAEDDYAPYVVTINKTTNDIYAIYRNWKEGDPRKVRTDYFVSYEYIVGFGFYGFGLLHLIGSHASAATSITRQLVDAGTLSNLPGGFKTKGMRIKGDDTPIQPAEFRDVDVPTGTLKENIVPLPYKEPSMVLYQLLQGIVEDGRRFASVSDAGIAEGNQNAPVGTTLALLERTLKVMSAVQARVHNSLKEELRLIKEVVRTSMGDSYDYEADPDKAVKAQDYDVVDIIPVSDPNATTMAQRIMQAQAVLQLADKEPQLYDKAELHKDMLSAMGIKNAEKFLPSLEEQKPRDPISENMAVLMGKPIRAFQYQDHESHLVAHQAFMQDPKMAMTLGQNPNAQMFFNALQSHIAEHAAYAYRKQAELLMGVPLPDPNEPMPQEAEYHLSSLLAQAAQKVLQTNQAEAAQQQAQQQAQDPLIQIEQKKLEIQALEVQVRKQEADNRWKMHMDEMGLKKEGQDQKIEVDRAKVAVQARAAQNKPANNGKRR